MSRFHHHSRSRFNMKTQFCSLLCFNWLQLSTMRTKTLIYKTPINKTSKSPLQWIHLLSSISSFISQCYKTVNSILQCFGTITQNIFNALSYQRTHHQQTSSPKVSTKTWANLFSTLVNSTNATSYNLLWSSMPLKLVY